VLEETMGLQEEIESKISEPLKNTLALFPKSHHIIHNQEKVPIRAASKSNLLKIDDKA
jgi:hypothetical protein